MNQSLIQLKKTTNQSHDCFERKGKEKKSKVKTGGGWPLLLLSSLPAHSVNQVSSSSCPQAIRQNFQWKPHPSHT
jgi:hypothetical protein